MDLAPRASDIHTTNNLGPLGLSEYGEAFIDFLRDKKLNGITDLEEIIDVCKKIEKDFFGIQRKTGEPYTAHLYEATRLYITLHGQKISQKRIIICLLHDNIEDIGEEEYEEIKKLYGEEIAFSISVLSKERIKDGESKAERNRKYNERFKNISDLKSFIWKKAGELGIPMTKDKAKTFAYMIGAIKIADRTHNLITLDFNYFSISQIEAKIRETEEYIIPLAQSMGNIFLVDSLRKELIRISAKVGRYKEEERVKGRTEETLKEITN